MWGARARDHVLMRIRTKSQRYELDLMRNVEPIQGKVKVGGRVIAEFHGWLELEVVLAELHDGRVKPRARRVPTALS